MSRSLVILILVLAILVAGLFWLSGRAGDRPQSQVEKSVSLENLS